MNWGKVPLGSVLPFVFDSFSGSTGASITLTGLAIGDILVYKGTSMTQRSSTSGFTLLDTDGIDIDLTTGIHGFSIDTGDNTDAGFFVAGSFYTVVVASVTIDSQTVNFVAGTFWLGPTLTVAGVDEVDVTYWLGTACATPTIGGVPEVDTTHVAGTAQTGGDLAAMITVVDDFVDTEVTAIKTKTDFLPSATAGAAGGVFIAGTNAATTVTTSFTTTFTGNLSGSVGSVTGSVGSVSSGGITAASIADGAIDRATFAADTGLVTIRSNTAQSGGATSIVLDASASASDNFYNNDIILITGGTGIGQARFITAYNGTSKTATVATWVTNPDVTSTFAILPFDAVAGASAPTAAQVATAVWQDSTAGDFNQASSIGKSLYTSGVVPGGTNGLFIAGTNAATSITTALTANITGNLSGSVASVTGAVGSVTGAVGSVTGLTASNLDATVSSRATPAQVNTEVLDVLNTDTFAEPGQGAPAATTTLIAKINYIYKFLRNKITTTATEVKVYDDAGTTVDQKSTISDDATTFTRGEFGSGP